MKNRTGNKNKTWNGLISIARTNWNCFIIIIDKRRLILQFLLTAEQGDNAFGSVCSFVGLFICGCSPV